MQNLNARTATIGFLLATVAAVGFSFKAILVKLAYAASAAAAGPVALDAVTLLSLRMLYSLPAFIVIAVRESIGKPPLTWRQGLVIVTLGVLGYYASSLLDFIGLAYISAGLERLVLATYPTLTLILSVVLFGETLTPRKLAACALCYLGIGAAFMHDIGSHGDREAVWIGSAFVFTAAISYAVYLVGAGRMIGQIGTQRFTAFAMLVSTVATLVHFFTTNAASTLAQPLRIQWLAVAMAAFSTVIPVFALAAAIRRIGAPSSALIGSTGPLITILLGWWLLGEPVSLSQFGGMLLVAAGVMLIGKK